MKLDAPWLADLGFRAVVEALAVGGARAFAVGGCVRNAILGLPPGDIDIATDAHPDEVVRLAGAAGLRAVPTGIDHGTVTVVAHGQGYEVTTFRHDVETDGRHAVVAFGRTLREDAERRDFTINALYADAAGKLTDPVGGLADLKAGRVRFIGDPRARIAEDCLRILRFFRFTAHFGDATEGIDAEGLAACADLQDGLDRLSVERVTAELVKLLSAPQPAMAVAAMQASGILGRVLPGADGAWLGPLVAAEAEIEASPDWRRRFVAIGGAALVDRLRLSRTDARAIALIATAASHGGGPAELGHRFGTDPAVSAILVRAVSVGSRPTAADLEAVRNGAAAVFPVRAADLMPAYEGAALGRRMADLKDRWIASGFTATRAELLG